MLSMQEVHQTCKVGDRLSNTCWAPQIFVTVTAISEHGLTVEGDHLFESPHIYRLERHSTDWKTWSIVEKKMKDGIYLGLIHGWSDFLKFSNNEPFLLESGKKSSWAPTVLCPSRLDKLKEVSLDQVRYFINDEQREKIEKWTKEEDILEYVRSILSDNKMNGKKL